MPDDCADLRLIRERLASDFYRSCNPEFMCIDLLTTLAAYDARGREIERLIQHGREAEFPASTATPSDPLLNVARWRYHPKGMHETAEGEFVYFLAVRDALTIAIATAQAQEVKRWQALALGNAESDARHCEALRRAQARVNELEEQIHALKWIIHGGDST